MTSTFRAHPQPLVPVSRRSRRYSRPRFRSTGRTAPRAGATKGGLRADVQGLRALAVVAVILNHVMKWPTGGFVGVDVFFVISGFLITGLLLREHDRTGTISFIGFYRRRVKRILPAAIVVLAATVIASYLVFNGARAQSVAVDAFYALFFSANWHFIAVGTDYFSATAPPSPLQHFWSLGVEEQFYFVWPWLMLLIFAVSGGKNLLRAHRTIAVVMVLLTAASFVWALRESSLAPESAYFSTLSRAWELGVGALLAVFGPALRTLPARMRPLLGWLGLATIVVSLFVVSDAGGFPAPWAALPVVGAALVIAAGTGGDSGVLPLANPLSGWIGELSYSLYLWHFPVFIVLSSLFPRVDAAFIVACLAFTLAASVLSFYLIEDPIRRSRLFERRSRPARPLDWSPDARQRAGAALTITLLALSTFFVAGIYAKQPSGSTQTGFTGVALAGGSAAAALPAPPTTSTALSAQITSALHATSWPSLTPTLDSVIGGPEAPAQIRPCGGTTPPALQACTFGSATAAKTIVIVGDSTSVAYTEMLKQVVQADPGYKLVALGAFGCPFVDLPIENTDAKVTAACPALKARAVTLIKLLKPSLLLVTDSYTEHENSSSGLTVSADAWRTGLTRMLQKVTPAAQHIALLSPPPASADVASCYTRTSTPSSCVSTLTDTWVSYALAERAVAKSVKGTWIDSRSWFCVSGSCPAFVGSAPVKLDLVHITQAYADKLGPFVLTDLKRMKLL